MKVAKFEESHPVTFERITVIRRSATSIVYYYYVIMGSLPRAKSTNNIFNLLFNCVQLGEAGGAASRVSKIDQRSAWFR